MASTGTENEGNTANEKTSLLNYLLTYLTRERREKRESSRYSLTTRISPEAYRNFDIICRRLGLVKRGNTNVALEGLITFFVEQYRDHPTVIQQTLTNVFVKAEPHSEVNINVAQKLEIQMIKRDLTFILKRIEKFAADPSKVQSLRMMTRSLNETLPKALRIYEKTFDPELEKLLKKLEKWI